MASMLIRDLPDEMGEANDASLADGPVRTEGDYGGLTRRLWEHPARELLHLLHGGRSEVQSTDAAELLGDLRAALDGVEIPDHYR